MSGHTSPVHPSKQRLIDIEILILDHLLDNPTPPPAPKRNKLQRLADKWRTKPPKKQVYDAQALVDDLELQVPELYLLREAINRLIRKKLLAVERDGRLIVINREKEDW